MARKLSNSQMNKLSKLRLSTSKTDSLLSVQIKDLLNESDLREYLKILGSRIQARNDKVTASIFIKRYAFLSVIYLYAMSAWNEKLSISFENVSIETDDNETLWLPSFRFADLETETFEEDRNKWRKTCLESLFKEHLLPLIDCLARITKVSKLILWENIAVYIYWLYETVLVEEGTQEAVKNRAKEDFQFIVFQDSGDIFGNDLKNPLTKYFNERIYIKEIGKEVRPRNTCCLSYLTINKQCCQTCPHICKSGN
ncbi:IucA/IucC family C-terminal-domain containing protein [Peribacillus huizhouensis]|uniref:Siderophore-iron reductase FhuF n=1 Tax=Peribacillus huizhouensis TaxID=1501239 RepID=A0ABR6CNC7_9BACI|nr:IucA/IucC family C-terminal-domain containing protein [Peribacillus huizhouensis]MBA9026196.1 siderophore-iron reductase FhuF [Peribacillus huizhouensis]